MGDVEMKKIKLNKFKLLEQMEKRKLKRGQLANLLGINKQILYRKMENGFSKTEVFFICHIFNVDDTDLMDRKGRP
jgi:hypothetical protein